MKYKRAKLQKVNIREILCFQYPASSSSLYLHFLSESSSEFLFPSPCFDTRPSFFHLSKAGQEARQQKAEKNTPPALVILIADKMPKTKKESSEMLVDKHCQRHNGPMGWHHNWRHFIASKFSIHMAPHAFVENSATIWPPSGATCSFKKFSHQVAPLAFVRNLATR